MPEMRFTVRWPDGRQSTHYSPSLVIEDYLTANVDYPVEDFVMRASEALGVASDRVRAKYGFACSRAQAASAELRRRADGFDPAARVEIVGFDRNRE